MSPASRSEPPAHQPTIDNLTFLRDVATRYWLHEETMDAIARDYAISRSTVSRALTRAKEAGMVRIHVVAPTQATNQLEEALSATFGIAAHVVTVPGNASELERLTMVSKMAGHVLYDLLSPGDVLGVAWGTTMVTLADNLDPWPLEDLTIVQINGAVNTHMSGLPWVGDLLARLAEALSASVVHFPVPAFFNDPVCKTLMWKEPAIQAILDIHQSIDVAMFSVGVLSGSLTSHVYANGYLSDSDIEQLRDDHVVGDICTVFIRQDGSFDNIPMNACATGLTPSELQRIPARLCVVAGVDKAIPLLAALRAKTMTTLVVDNATARAVLRLAEDEWTTYPASAS